MKRTLVLRPQLALSRPWHTGFPFPPWVSRLQNELYSTVPEVRQVGHDIPPSLLGGSRKKNPQADRHGAKSQAQHPQSQTHSKLQAHSQSQTRSSSKPQTQHSKSQTSAQSTSRTQSSLPKQSRKKRRRDNSLEKSRQGRSGRKPEAESQSPSSRKRRSEGIAQSDLESVRRTLILPKREEYPQLPYDFLNSPKSTLHDIAKELVSFDIKISAHNSRFSCSVTCTSGLHEPLFTEAEGRSKKEAEQIAFLKMLSKYHENGVMELLLSPVNNNTMQVERDAKIDIYNYAARYNSVPKISPLSISRRVGKQVRNIWQVTVELVEQDIKVVGLGKDLKSAEVAASIKFKLEAERYQSQQSESIVVRDSTAVNTSNARDFVQFYKAIHPGSRLDFQVSSVGTDHWCGTVLLNGNPVGEPTTMTSKKGAEDLAYLTAGVALSKQDPSLFEQFRRAPRTSKGEFLRPLPSFNVPIDQDILIFMRDTLSTVRQAGLPDEEEELPSDMKVEDGKHWVQRLPKSEEAARSQHLLNSLETYYARPDLAQLRRKREELPMNQYQEKVIEIVQNMYCIIIGATGSGKTTQVPQILLDEAIKKGEGASCNIICTQPRRIAATSVARRVAEERGEHLRNSVGFHIRFDAQLPKPGGSITYCTTGILLQRLKHDPDWVMDNISHLIIDEVHERDILMDFLLIMLKKIIKHRSLAGKTVPKLILMSATIDADLFASYFTSGQKSSKAPTLSVPGRTFPVQEIYFGELLRTLNTRYTPAELKVLRDDKDSEAYCQHEIEHTKQNFLTDEELAADRTTEGESTINWKDTVKYSEDGKAILSDERDALIPSGFIATTIAHICKTTDTGAILVFLPGLGEIIRVDNLLRHDHPLKINFNDEGKFRIYTLHSSLQNAQDVVFDTVPSGCRKIILATNIAETSITIPDVQYVVDTGKHRENQYDPRSRITHLKCSWISKSNSKQRAGRAGRVQNGTYYALFSENRYKSFRAVGLPEILRCDLQETCLDVKAQAFSFPIGEFLAEALEPPPPTAVDQAVLGLVELDALTEEEELTSLGRMLASLPVNPSLGKMILLGIIFRCLDPMILLGAAHEARSLFVRPLEQRREADAAKKPFAEGTNSDHIAFINAMQEMRKIEREAGDRALLHFAHKKYIHLGTYRHIKRIADEIEEILIDKKLISRDRQTMQKSLELGGATLNQYSHHTPVITALIMAGVSPNIACATTPKTYRTRAEQNVLLQPSNVNAFQANSKDWSPPPFGTIACYSNMRLSNDGSSLFLTDSTEATPLTAILFGGRIQTRDSHSRHLDNWIQVDNWLPFFIKSNDFRATKIIVEFRKALRRVMAGAFKELSHQEELAANPMREAFAAGLVEVLNRDAGYGSQLLQSTAEMPINRGSQGGYRSSYVRRTPTSQEIYRTTDRPKFKPVTVASVLEQALLSSKTSGRSYTTNTQAREPAKPASSGQSFVRRVSGIHKQAK